MEVPPAKNFIVVISFLGIFATLATLFVASGLTYESGSFSSPSYPEEYWGLSDIEAIATSFTINCSVGGGHYQVAWGIDEGFGHNFLFKSNVVSGEVKIENQHYYYFLWFPHGHHAMNWLAKTTGEDYGKSLVQSEFDEVSIEDTDNNITNAAFTVKCDHVTMHSVVAFNNTAWNNATEAFQNDDLHVQFAIEWDELGTGLNAWNIIAGILFFSLPDINFYINAFLAIPIWAAIAYLAIAFTLAAISVLPFT